MHIPYDLAPKKSMNIAITIAALVMEYAIVKE
jgi:hypothetical protein